MAATHLHVTMPAPKNVWSDVAMMSTYRVARDSWPDSSVYRQSPPPCRRSLESCCDLVLRGTIDPLTRLMMEADGVTDTELGTLFASIARP